MRDKIGRLGSVVGYGMVGILALFSGLTALGEDVEMSLNGGSVMSSFNGRGPLDGSYTIHGPGTFTSTGRVYPNNLSHIVTFDQGVVVWLTTHNNSGDGLIVSGKQACEVRLADCTVGSRFSTDTCLARYVTLVLTDTQTGATITTHNDTGTPILIHTKPNQQAIIKGSGKLNLAGGGTFRFDSTTTFSNTGMITVRDGTTAILATEAPPRCPFHVEAGSVLTFTTNSYTNVKNQPVGHVTVSQGGVFDLGIGSATITLAGGLTMEEGSILRMTVGVSTPCLDFKGAGPYNDGSGVYFPKDGGKVIISPVAGNGLVAGQYTLVNNVRPWGLEAFTLDKTTLNGLHVRLDKVGDALALVVSEEATPVFSVWTGGVAGAWDGTNWDGGALFPAGCGARFATSGAAIALSADSPQVARLSFDQSAVLAGDGTLNLTQGDVFVAADSTATLDVPLAIGDSMVCKHGEGTLVVNAAKTGTIYSPQAFEGQIEFQLGAGESAEIVSRTDDCAVMRNGGISLIGPGTFTSSRLYPRNTSATNVVDGGATVILSGNSANDGLIVSGGLPNAGVARSGAVRLGKCTVKSSYATQTLLQRFVNIIFSDTDEGTTFSTESASGIPITLTTANDGIFAGEGRLTITGSGTFVFSSRATFAQTGETAVKGGASVRLETDVTGSAFTVESGATLSAVGGARTVAALTFAEGAMYNPVLNASAQGCIRATGGVAWPASGTVTVILSGEAKLANGDYTIIANAGADAATHVTLSQLIPGKAAECFVEGGDLKVRISTGDILDLTWKGGSGAWNDSDGWNGDEWIDFSRVIFPAGGGTVSLAEDVNASGLSFFGPYTLTGSCKLVNLAVDDVLYADSDVTIEPEFVPSSKRVIKQGPGQVTLTGVPAASGVTFDLRDGGIAYTQPAESVAKVTYSPNTTFGLGGGTISYSDIAFSADTNRFLNGTIMFSTDQFKTLANSTVILDDAAAINGTNARLWCYGGSHLILGENCGTLTFTRDATSYVGAEDRGQCDWITILGGALEILPASGKEHFAIGARHEVGVTGIVYLVDGRLTTIRTVMGRRWDEWGDDPCQSYGELIMDGGTFSSDELLVGTMKSGSEYGKGAAVLRFNGGTAVLGKFHTFPLTDRDILFNGTTFKPQADADDFLFAMPCHQSETVAVGEGGLIIDTDGYTVGSNFSPSGSGGLVKRGEGTLTLKADLPCTGLTQVEAGTLTFEGTRSLGGGIEVASGAVFAPENARVMMAGTLTFADGAKLALTVANGTAGSFSASQYIQEGTLEIVLTAPEAYSGVCALIDDLTGFDVARITVTGLPAGAVTGVAGNRLMLYGAGASVWKGGAGTWADLDGWNGGSWVEGSLARFETAAGSEVTLSGPVNAAGLAFAESASLLSAGTGATLALGDGAIAVPSGRTVVIEAETVPQGGLLKTGLGTLTVDGIQPSLGSIQVEAGTLNVKGTVRGLSAFTAEEGSTVRFAADASVSVTGLATFLGTLSADPDGLATLEAQTIEITPGFIVPAGLELHAQTIPYVTLTNNVDGFTVDGMLVDDDTLMVGYVLNGTGARTGGEEYQIDGTGTLRVKEMRMRSQSVQHFTVNRLEITGAHPYATASWGEMAFDGTTVAAYGQDISADTSDGVTLRLLEGGVTFDTLDAADGMTARTITLADGNGAIIGSGSLTKTGPGTLALAMEQTYTGETWVEGGTLRVARPTSTAGFTVTGTDSALQFEGAVGQVQQVSLGAGTKLVVGDGVASATVAPQALTCAAGTAIELAMGSGGLSGSPFLDLRDATVSFAPDAPPVVQVVLKGEMPDGAYDVIAYAPTDAETLAGCVFSFIDATDAGCTATFENVATEGVVRLHLGGSPVEPVANEWVGRAGGSWNEGLNWAATASPLATLPLVFAGSRGLTNVNDVGMAVYPSLTFAANAGPFDVDLKGAGQGIGVIASAAVDVQVVRNYVNTTDLRKSGTGMVELVDPSLGGKLVLDAGSPIALRASDGNRVTVNSNGGSWSSGPLSYLGPGEFLTSRIYPNSAATPVVFDEGATVWITTHNGAKNGLIVAGGTDRKLLAGRCTIGSRFTDPMTELVRVITVELTDEDEGTTVTTDNVEGTPIIIQTTCNASATSRNQAYITGAGRLRIGGNGSFVFNPQTTFLYTGATEVMPGATAVVKPDVAVQGSPFVVAGTLVLEGGALAMPLSVEAGGTLDMPGTPSLGGVSLVDGSKVRLYVAGNGTVSPIACEVEPPDAGTAQVELECAADLAADTVLILTQGANLTAADASKFTVSCVREGTEVNKRLFQKMDVENGELIAVFKEFGTVLLVR